MAYIEVLPITTINTIWIPVRHCRHLQLVFNARLAPTLECQVFFDSFRPELKDSNEVPARLAKTALMLVKRHEVLLIRELITKKIINIPVIRKSEKRKQWII